MRRYWRVASVHSCHINVLASCCKPLRRPIVGIPPGERSSFAILYSLSTTVVKLEWNSNREIASGRACFNLD
ncbi:hypothetical protein K450DRAFT_243814 [Umbelopsis ramanniana AG]|uniref:Uncharacterized protein n=1 Tax=Umbelopsis ramanniana AG TaxID=1314678 RepID=A0AAD5E7X0_UMBRA|nr:uncharacterized protein K450DRAFT_243814 [Umbelopsis ramanniana AG]KAI8579088.1 hypothetical protein K450DRAFT_243814 [Umbelopsis ramanniana AG]